MIKLTDIRKTTWIKIFLFGALLSSFYAFLAYSLNAFAGKTIFNPVLVFSVLIANLALLPIFIVAFSRPEKRIQVEYRQKEKALEKSGKSSILKYFDERFYEKLVFDELNWVVVDGFELANKILEKSEESGDDELKFFALVRLARCYYKEDQYQMAIDCLQQALLIYPNTFVVNMKTAELYEMIGSGEAAIKHYSAALMAESDLSQTLKQYIQSQIDRVKKEGPREKKPAIGAKWLTG